ncbi:MAG: lysozyme inhibitor LprI family protein [Caulobacter sp.]
MRIRLFAAVLAAGFLGAGAASAASFDCNKARTPDEKAICADRALNDQDVRMAQLYDIVRHLVAMGGRGAIMDDQTVWLKARRTCGANRACIGRAYTRRIAQLNSVLETRVYPNGPF